MPSYDDIIKNADKLTVGALLALIVAGLVIGGVRKWFVFGWTYREKCEQLAEAKKDGNEWKQMAIAYSGIGYAIARQQHPSIPPPPPRIAESAIAAVHVLPTQSGTRNPDDGGEL